MERPARFQILITVGAIAAGSGRVSAQEVARPTMIVRAYNFASVSPPTLQHASDWVVRIYRDAGVDVLWIDVTGDVEHPAETSDPPTVFTARVLIRSAPTEPSLSAEMVMGTALAASDTEGISWVYYERVRAAALRNHVATEDLLGLAIAHEIGHLVLPPPAHSSKGVMRPYWMGKEISFTLAGTVGFSPSEAASIRAKVGGCCKR